MTGNVPYYGGRFTPAQAYAASHPAPRPERPAPAPKADRPQRDPVEALDHLLEEGLIDQQEYEQLRSRIKR